MAKRALLVGIDEYDEFSKLTGCVADAVAMQQTIKRNADGSPNYSCRLLAYGGEHREAKVTRRLLRETCRELFDYTGDVLLHFSGHGALTETGGYLATCDAQTDDWGIPMQEIIQLANNSKARDILLILDCCHSGDAANSPLFNSAFNQNPLAILRENMTVLAASRPSQLAVEFQGHGLFTAAVLEALDGGAADNLGWVTAQSIYAYVERGFGDWVQRPIYKSHTSELTVVRQCAPLIERLKLHDLLKYFPTPEHRYQLDPEYEPEDEFGRLYEPVNKEKVQIAKQFKEYRDAGLLRTSVSGEQFFWAARNSHTVELTLRGREYWRLVTKDRI